MPEPTLTRQWCAAPCSTGFAHVHQEGFWPLLSQKVRDGGDSSWLREFLVCQSLCYNTVEQLQITGVNLLFHSQRLMFMFPFIL